MASQIRWSPRDASNLEEIFNYITKDSHYYRIVYRLKDDVIEIVAICHGAKPLQDIL